MKRLLHGTLFASIATVGCFGGGALPTPAGTAGQGGQAGAAGTAPGGILIVPDGNGVFDGTNAAGVVGAWWWAGDYYGAPNVPGAGDCPAAGFTASQCSVITAPGPATTFAPDPGGRGMCASGVAAQVLPDATGQLAWSSIWGNIIGFGLNTPASDVNAWPDSLGQYDAVARGITGFAFDIDGDVTKLRVAFQTQGTENSPAYWAGTTMDVSPVMGPGHYEIRWAEVGGPAYLAAPPPFDPSKLEEIQFHVPASNVESTSYSFCIRNTVMLTGN